MSSAMIQTKFGAGSLEFDSVGETGCDSAAQQRLRKARIAKKIEATEIEKKLVFIAYAKQFIALEFGEWSSRLLLQTGCHPVL